MALLAPLAGLSANAVLGLRAARPRATRLGEQRLSEIDAAHVDEFGTGLNDRRPTNPPA